MDYLATEAKQVPTSFHSPNHLVFYKETGNRASNAFSSLAQVSHLSLIKAY